LLVWLNAAQRICLPVFFAVIQPGSLVRLR